MSRIGKKIVTMTSGVTVKIDGQTVMAKGPKGELAYNVHPIIKIVKNDDGLLLTAGNPEDRKEKEIWGTNRQMVNNIIIGVSAGYRRELEINGVGYKAEIKDQVLILHVGYSHAVRFDLPQGITGKVEKNVITLDGIDKQLLGETSARIRKIRKPEPYKGKGIKYMEEIIKRKAGKQVKGAEGK